jgi:hypothetical protein
LSNVVWLRRPRVVSPDYEGLKEPFEEGVLSGTFSHLAPIRASISAAWCNTLDFAHFFFSFVFGLDLLFCGLVVLKPGEIILESSPKWLVNLKIIPRPCHFHLGPNSIFFLRNIPFSIKGITMSVLGCEATHIYVILKIPK